MYKIDFTPPPETENTATIKVKKTPTIKNENNSNNIFSETHLISSKSLFKNKFIYLILALCLGTYSFASYYIPLKFTVPITERIYSDVEFANLKTLSSNFELEFESPTAQSIYNIEYQETALKNLKTIISYSDNDATTLQSVLPLEIPNLESSITEINENKKILLIGTSSKSTIEKFPININYALHYENNKLIKIQAFLYTSEDFMIKDRLAGSTFAHWDKKSFIAIDKNISIFEANIENQPKPETLNKTNDNELINNKNSGTEETTESTN